MTAQTTHNGDPRRALRDLLQAADRAPVERQAALPAAVGRAAESAGVSVADLREYAFGPRQYSFNDLAGCVVQRRSRITGTIVGLYQAEQAGMDPEAGRWITVCEAHSTCVKSDGL